MASKKFQKTKVKLFEATISFLSTNSLNELTIKKICYLSNISRTTFYAHYDTINDLIIDLKRNYILNDFYSKNEFLSKNNMNLLISYFEKNKNFFSIYSKIITKQEKKNLLNIVLEKLRETRLFNDETKLYFIASGYISTMFSWFNNGCDITSKQYEWFKKYFDHPESN